jgi:hypothetical protein
MERKEPEVVITGDEQTIAVALRPAITPARTAEITRG